MTYATEAELIREESPEDREHFMQCEECQKWFDMRSFDDVAFHCFSHIERPDFNIEPGIRTN